MPDLSTAADCFQPAVHSDTQLGPGSKCHSWPRTEAAFCTSPLRAGSAPGALCRDCASSNTLDQLAVPQLPEQGHRESILPRSKRKRSQSEAADPGTQSRCAD